MEKLPPLTSLDFSDNRSSLKAFLRDQTAFRDYDFDGSNMSVLLDVLSYNTYLTVFYLNMVAGESHLGTAKLRSSAVSRAKMLNYVPRSARASEAVLSLSIPTTNASSLTIPRDTLFAGSNSNGLFTFSTREAVTLRSSTGTFSAPSITVYEGSYVTESYVADSRDEAQRFTVTSANADTASLEVTVSTPGASDSSLWDRATTLYGLSGESNVYFLQGAENELFEVEFGDGVLGASVPDGALVTLSYMVCSGSAADGVDTFVMTTDLGAMNYTDVTSPLVVETIGVSDGGGDPETIYDIKRRAPRHFQVQERAVIARDYEDVALAEFPSVADAHAFGGEEITDTVQYGRVFVAVVGHSGRLLTEAGRDAIKATLEAKSGKEVFVLNPETLYVYPSLVVRVDSAKLSYTKSQLEALVDGAVVMFERDNLQRFNSHLYMSRLEESASQSDRSILSVEASAVISKEVVPSIGVAEPIDFELNNAIEHGVKTSEFISAGKRYLVTDTVTGIAVNGTLYLLEVNPTLSSPSYRAIGRVNYDNGVVAIGAVSVSSLAESSALSVRATARSRDIFARRGDVIKFSTRKVEASLE